MSDREKNTVVLPSYNRQPNHVLPLYAAGSLPTWGCAKDCGCGTPDGPKIAKQYNIPHEAQSCIDLGSLNTFIDEVNEIIEDSYFPLLPLMWSQYCIPFLPESIMGCYASRGVKKMNELLEKTNPTMRNCHWLA
jgi:hypothetical protein